LLLVSLVLLYWLLYQLLRTADDMSFAFTVFLVAGTAQVLFGLYQVLAGALNHYQKWRLPIGHLGLVHREYINSVWGRPYGTQVEPDFYGAFCMVFALIFIILLFANGGKIKKWLWAGAVLSLLGLFFSFVRMAWLIFFLLLPLLALAKKKLPFFRFTWMAAALIASVTVGASVFAAVVVPPIRQICETRFATKVPASTSKRSAWRFSNSLLNTQNVRLTLIQLSLYAWREHPFFGNGPGSFPFTYFRATEGAAGVRRKIEENAFRQTNPSMLFTVLEDSGLLGLFLFLVLAAKFVFLSYKKLAGLSSPLAPQTFALAIALAALLLSYMLTNGLWLPFTWVFLALAAAHLREFPLRSDGPAGPNGGPCA
jgi:O-antigen ligase